jgi:hypothetical protein
MQKVLERNGWVFGRQHFLENFLDKRGYNIILKDVWDRCMVQLEHFGAVYHQDLQIHLKLI